MTKLDFFGHFFYFSIFLGMLLISAKDHRGWAFRFIGETGWIVIGMIMGMSSIWLWGFAFMAVDLWSWIRWSEADWLAAAAEEGRATGEVIKAMEEDALFWPSIEGPDCTDEEHQPFCRPYKEKVKANGKKRQRKTPNPEAKSRRSTSRAKKMPKVQRKVRKASRNTR